MKELKLEAFIGTLQAGYTDFHYLRPVWQRTTEKDALIGVSMTGIASNKLDDLDVTEANVVKEENKRVADLIGVNSSCKMYNGKTCRYNIINIRDIKWYSRMA